VTDVFICAALAIVLIFVIVDDLQNYRIRNEAIATLVFLFLLRTALKDQYWEAYSHIIFAAILFAIFLLMYARGLMGGGDVKLLGAAFLWLGRENAFVFSLLLLVLTILYTLLAKLGVVPKRMIVAGAKIPFGPCIGASWLVMLFLEKFFEMANIGNCNPSCP